MSKIVEGIAKDLKSIPEKLKAKTGNVDKKKLLLMNLPYVLAGYFCDKMAVAGIAGAGRFRKDDGGHGGDGGLIF